MFACYLYPATRVTEEKWMVFKYLTRKAAMKTVSAGGGGGSSSSQGGSRSCILINKNKEGSWEYRE